MFHKNTAIASDVNRKHIIFFLIPYPAVKFVLLENHKKYINTSSETSEPSRIRLDFGEWPRFRPIFIKCSEDVVALPFASALC